jgi:hypothetical protein
MRKKMVFSKKELQKYLDELVDLAKSVTPDVTTELLVPGVEEQHAWLTIFVPDEFEEQIDEMIGERVSDIFLETGYDIGAIVYEKSRLENATSEVNV